MTNNVKDKRTDKKDSFIKKYKKLIVALCFVFAYAIGSVANAGMVFLPEATRAGQGGSLSVNSEYQGANSTGEKRLEKYACSSGEYASLRECNDAKLGYQTCEVSGYCYRATGSCPSGEYESESDCNSNKPYAYQTCVKKYNDCWKAEGTCSNYDEYETQTACNNNKVYAYQTCSIQSNDCWKADGCPSGEYETETDCNNNKLGYETCNLQSSDCWKPTGSCPSGEYETKTDCNNNRSYSYQSCSLQSNDCWKPTGCPSGEYVTESTCNSNKASYETCTKQSNDCWEPTGSCPTICEPEVDLFYGCTPNPSYPECDMNCTPKQAMLGAPGCLKIDPDPEPTTCTCITGYKGPYGTTKGGRCDSIDGSAPSYYCDDGPPAVDPGDPIEPPMDPCGLCKCPDGYNQALDTCDCHPNDFGPIQKCALQ